MFKDLTSKSMVRSYAAAAGVVIVNAALGNPLGSIGNKIRGALPFLG